jgi:hypothetical protein
MLNIKKCMAKLVPFVLASVGLLQADPFDIGGILYTAGGPSETVNVSFLMSNGGATVNQYDGYVRLLVSGTGESSGTQLNDAFYVFTNAAHGPIAPVNNASFYQLAIDTSPLVGSPGSPTPAAHNARNHIVYDVIADVEVASPYVPAYQGTHEYDFIINVANLESYLGGLSTINFGVNDGIFADNSGSYVIQVQQLVAVPEPGSIVLLASAAALGYGIRRIRRR